jgi:hypothetical protein
VYERAKHASHFEDILGRPLKDETARIAIYKEAVLRYHLGIHVPLYRFKHCFGILCYFSAVSRLWCEHVAAPEDQEFCHPFYLLSIGGSDAQPPFSKRLDMRFFNEGSCDRTML